jgi:hypothetical protein
MSGEIVFRRGKRDIVAKYDDCKRPANGSSNGQEPSVASAIDRAVALA